MIYLRLLLEFFRTGLFSVGGGLATLPFLYDMSARTGWFTAEMLTDMIAVSESTPGPIGVNMATYAGYTAAGPLGALCATFGLILPSFIVILIVSRILARFRSNKYVDAAFYAVRACSVGLIAAAGLLVFKVSFLNIELFGRTAAIGDLFRLKPILLAIVVFVLTNYVKPVKKLHPVFIIAFSAAAGILFGF